ncbi:phage baseplate upper protein [Staphylococcus haemolyticus]|uniref:phage baseplate upper protein n=1 Tax=Staphylococcus haemolyticus TaxID=1283 RepID=UPI001879E1E5|nr:phage baseplate upper protein [Staphylococcus haemolyticus]MBE7295270.1 BppU family phage baseplate upper protein [Staphylococcus haemolyticus]
MFTKNKDIEAHIRANNIDIGDIGSRFYTEDKNSAIIKVKIYYNGQSIDLSKTDLEPRLDIFSQDGSIFLDEPIEIISPTIGLIEYQVSSQVIKHAGKMNCKLFLKDDEQSIHVANFSFNILDSGVEKAIAKEINLNLVESTVKQIMSEDLVNLLNDGFKDKLTGDLENYLSTHSEEFKGPKGDEGPQGEQGPQGLQGEQGLPGKDGSTISYTDTGWQLLSLINGTTQAGRLNLPEYRLVTINDTNLLFIRGAVTNITSRTMVFAKLPTNISQKIRSYAEYSKVKINSYMNTSSIYNITVITSGELKITFEPNSTVDASSPYYIEGTISL